MPSSGNLQADDDDDEAVQDASQYNIMHDKSTLTLETLKII